LKLFDEVLDAEIKIHNSVPIELFEKVLVSLDRGDSPLQNIQK